jgi:hypothetical protein
MLSFMQITENTAGLTLAYPLWIGAVFAALAVIAVAYTIIARRRLRRYWPLLAAAAIASWAGVYFTTFSTTITPGGGAVYGFLRYDHHVRWQDARDVYLERRGGEWTIVVRSSSVDAYDFNVGDLAVESRDSVMAYIVDHMPASAFRPDTALLKREGEGARPVSFSADEQI